MYLMLEIFFSILSLFMFNAGESLLGTAAGSFAGCLVTNRFGQFWTTACLFGFGLIALMVHGLVR